MIKECFFEHLNSFEGMSPEKLENIKNAHKIKMFVEKKDLTAPVIGDFPTDIEVNKKICTFLNYNALQSWRKTCKSTFFGRNINLNLYFSILWELQLQ